MPAPLRSALLTAIATTLVGCSGNHAGAPADGEALLDKRTPPSAEPVDSVVRKLLDDAGHADTVVQAASRVVWRNASLGCPEAGRAYAQVLVPGYLILGHAAGKPLRLHASDRGRVVACPDDRAQAPLEQTGN